MGMTRASLTDLTAGQSLLANYGYKLKLKSIFLKLITGTVAGSRTASVYHLDASSGQAISLLSAVSSSTVSSSVNGSMDSMNPAGQSGFYAYYKEIEIVPPDSLSLQMTLQSGDTVNLIVIYDEVPA